MASRRSTEVAGGGSRGFRRKPSARERRDAATFIAFVFPNFLLLGVFVFWPIVYSLYLGFHRWNMIAPRKSFYGLQNFTQMAADPVFWQSMRNTLVLAGSVVVVKLVVALALAMLLNRKLRGGDLYRAIIFSPTFTTSVAVAMVWDWIFDPAYGLLRVFINFMGMRSPNWLGDVAWALPAIVIVVIWSGIGYDMVIFLAGLKNIPGEYYEAAQLDGAGPWQCFRRITLPLLSPTTFFLTIVSVIGSLKAFDIVAILTEGGPLNSTNVIVYYLYQNAFQWFKAGYASALALVLFALIMAITLVQTRLSRRWVHY